MSAPKRFILLLCALAAVTQVSAGGLRGIEWGATVGVRYGGIKVYAPGGLMLTPRIGYDAGLQASLLFGDFAVQPELNYTYSTARLTTAGGGATVKAHDVEIPLLASLRVLPVVRFNAGPVFGAVSNAKYTNAVGETLRLGGLRPTFGYAAGVAACIAEKLLIDVRYTGYFSRTTNEYNADSGMNPTTFRTRLWSAGIKIGYLF